MKNGQYHLIGLVSIETVSEGVELLQIVLRGHEEELIYMFGRHSEVSAFLNKDVIIEFREEIIKGKFVPCVANLSVISQVTTLDKEEGIKLYIDEDFELGTSNIIFNDIREGDTVDKMIVYCIDHTFESSAKASWATLTILDKKRNIRKLRVFDPDRSSLEFKGKFLKCQARYNKYGFTASDVYIHSESQIDANPLIAIAKRAVMSTVANDAPLQEVMTKTDYMTKIQNYNLEKGFESGFLLVRLAVELALIKQVTNISKHLDEELLIRLAVCEKLYVTTNREDSTASLELQNILTLARYPLARNKALFTAIDFNPQVTVAEAVFYEGIKKSADVVVNLYGDSNYKTAKELIGGK